MILEYATVWDIPRLCECEYAWIRPPRGPWQLQKFSRACPLKTHQVSKDTSREEWLAARRAAAQAKLATASKELRMGRRETTRIGVGW